MSSGFDDGKKGARQAPTNRDRGQRSDDGREAVASDRLRLALRKRVTQRKAERDALDGRDNKDVAIPDGSGAPLPTEQRTSLEGKLGADLSGVRLHTGADSASAAKGLKAKAFAEGQNIHFGAGQFRPDTREGAHLLAHEVAHTVQDKKTSGTVARKHDPEAEEKESADELEVSQPDDPAEREADEVADAVTGHGGPKKTPSIGAVPASIGRKIHLAPEDGKSDSGNEKKDDEKKADEKKAAGGETAGAKAVSSASDGPEVVQADGKSVDVTSPGQTILSKYGHLTAEDFSSPQDPRLVEIQAAAEQENQRITGLVRKALEGAGVTNVEIQNRAKTLPSILGKLKETPGMTISQIKDLSGVRINIPDVNQPGFAQISEIVGLIRGALGIGDGAVKDYNAKPNSWGYTGRVHMFSEGPEGVTSELQAGSKDLSEFIEAKVVAPNGKPIELHDLTGFKGKLYGIELPPELQAEYTRIIGEIARCNKAGQNVAARPELKAEIDAFKEKVQTHLTGLAKAKS